MEIEVGDSGGAPKVTTVKRTESWPQINAVVCLLIGFSVIYFADVWLRASEKYFWTDEITTIYLCRLPNFSSLWEALRRGMDFNPPLFYMLTNASQAIFGEGLVSTRLPQIIAFWMLCLSLFQFVRRTSGTTAGFIAMLLPMFTTAFFYAYEARPHGMTLGFCGLALVCWQMSLERPDRRSWLVGFSACLCAAFLMHCYAFLVAAPFALTELFRTVKTRHLHWPMLIALITPIIIASATYIPLLLAYKSIAGGTSFEKEGTAGWALVLSFYPFLVAPCIPLIVLALALVVVNRTGHLDIVDPTREKRVENSTLELVLGLSFLALPIMGVMFAKIIQGPLMVRYFLPSLIGFCIVVGTIFGRRKTAPWIAVTLAITMTLIIGEQFARLVWHRHKGWGENLIEPISGRPMNTTPGQPLDRYRLLVSEASNSHLPIAILTGWDFAYLLHYAPHLLPRLYYINTAASDFYYRALRDFRPLSLLKYNPQLTFHEFCRRAPAFLVYGLYRDGEMNELSEITETGRTIKLLKISDGHFLAEVETKGTARLDDQTRSRTK